MSVSLRVLSLHPWTKPWALERLFLNLGGLPWILCTSMHLPLKTFTNDNSPKVVLVKQSTFKVILLLAFPIWPVSKRRVRNYPPPWRKEEEKPQYVQLKQSLCFQSELSPGHSDSLLWGFSSCHLARAPLTFSASSSIPKGQYHIEDTAPNVDKAPPLVKWISDEALGSPQIKA